MTQSEDNNSAEVLTVAQAAQVLGVSVAAIRNAVKDNRLRSAVVDNVLTISRADLEVYRQRTRPYGYKPSGRPPKNPSGVKAEALREEATQQRLPDREDWEEDQLIYNLRLLSKGDRQLVLALVGSMADAQKALKHLRGE